VDGEVTVEGIMVSRQGTLELVGIQQGVRAPQLEADLFRFRIRVLLLGNLHECQQILNLALEAAVTVDFSSQALDSTPQFLGFGWIGPQLGMFELCFELRKLALFASDVKDGLRVRSPGLLRPLLPGIPLRTQVFSLGFTH
jgi:hypothetical protein